MGTTMTIERTVRPIARKKRPHPAATARMAAAGLAASGTCVLVAVFGLGGQSAAVTAATTGAELLPTAPAQTSTTLSLSAQPHSRRAYGQQPSGVASDNGVGQTAGAPITGTAGRSAPTGRSSSS